MTSENSVEPQPSSTQPGYEAPVEDHWPFFIFPSEIAAQEHYQSPAPDAKDSSDNHLLWGDGIAQWVMAITGIAALMISAWAVWLVKRTLDEAKITAEQAKRATEAAFMAIEATEDGLLRQIRPWLIGNGISAVSVTDLTADGVKYERAIILAASVSNVGQSPAINASAVTTRCMIDADGQIPEFNENSEGGFSTIGQGGSYSARQHFIVGEEFELFVSNSVDFVIYCKFTYAESCAPDNVRFTETTYRCKYQGQTKNSHGDATYNISVTIEGPQNVCI